MVESGGKHEPAEKQAGITEHHPAVPWAVRAPLSARPHFLPDPHLFL